MPIPHLSDLLGKLLDPDPTASPENDDPARPFTPPPSLPSKQEEEEDEDDGPSFPMSPALA